MKSSNLLKRLKRGFLSGIEHGGGLWFMASLAIANIGNFAFHAIASNRMGPGSYGALGSLLALTLAVSLPAAALQVATTKAVAQAPKEFESSARLLTLRVAKLVSACAIIVALTSPFVSTFLHLDSVVPVLWMAAFLIPAFTGSVFRGLLLAEGRLGALATSILFSTSLKVLLAWYFLKQDTHLATATSLVFFAELALMLGLGVSTRRWLVDGLPLQVRWTDFWSSTAAFWGMWAMLAVDLSFARHFLSPGEAGVYVAAATVARAVLFVPQSIALVAHARMVTGTRAQAISVLRGTLVTTVAISVAVIAFTSLVGGAAITRVFGEEFQPSILLIAILATTSGLLAVTNLLVLYRLSQGLSAKRVWLGPIFISLGAWTVHSSSIQVALCALLGTLICLVILRPRTPTPPISGPPTLLNLSESELDVSVVVASYDCAPISVRRISSLLGVMDTTTKSFEVIVIESPTVTSTQQHGAEPALIDIAHQAVVFSAPEEIAGWGTAIRTGISQARGRHIVLLDAAEDISPEHIPAFLDLLTFFSADAVVGSKRHPKSVVQYPGPRRLASRTYQLLVLALFRLSVRDPQVGIKAFTRESLADALPHLASQGAGIDIELLAVSHKLKHRRIVEAPVTIEKEFSRSLSWRTATRIVIETIAIHRRVRQIKPQPASYPASQPARSQLRQVPATIDLRTLPAS